MDKKTMTDEQLKLEKSRELDRTNLQDLKAIMNTPEGRRFFSWLLMRCGQDVTSFTRDSRTYFNEGMRNIALILLSCCRALGLPGIDLMQQAEREYVQFQDLLERQLLSRKVE